MFEEKSHTKQGLGWESSLVLDLSPQLSPSACSAPGAGLRRTVLSHLVKTQKPLEIHLTLPYRRG